MRREKKLTLPLSQIQLVVGHCEVCHRCHHHPQGQMGLDAATCHWEEYHKPTMITNAHNFIMMAGLVAIKISIRLLKNNNVNLQRKTLRQYNTPRCGKAKFTLKAIDKNNFKK